MAAVTRGMSASSAKVTTIPVFLAPAFSSTCSSVAIPSSRCFSTSVSLASRRDKHNTNNKKRGVSAMRGTGPMVSRGLWRYDLPEPVTRVREPKQTDYEDTANHGLWGFFHTSRKAMLEPAVEASHGRSWSYSELSIKSFEDLHKLYWLCVKEQNRVLTGSKEMSRVRAGYGQAEIDEKIRLVKSTMRNIRDVLADRQFKYEEGMALFNQEALSTLLPDEAQTEDDFYSNFNEDEASDDYEDLTEIQQAEIVSPTVKSKSKIPKQRLVLKDRVLRLK